MKKYRKKPVVIEARVARAAIAEATGEEVRDDEA